ncbi:hypothetical protein P5V15_012697 [Pogonomyrmex californicus]
MTLSRMSNNSARNKMVFFIICFGNCVNRKQKFEEDLAALGLDLKRLSRLAYPECSPGVQDKIACSQFIVALVDGFIKQTLQMEGHTSLRVAVERVIAVKIFKENSFPKFQERDRKGKISFEVGHERNFLNKGEIFARNYKQNRGKFNHFNSK